MANEQFINKVLHGDCLEWMKEIEDKSVDMILCDLPYQVTACEWDSIIPFGPLWEQYERIIKENGAIVLTAVQPFTSALIMSNPKLFRHEWIWDKKKGANFFKVKSQPLRTHESILVFGKNKVFYYPQMRKGKMRNKKMYSSPKTINNELKSADNFNDLYYPVSILDYSNALQKGKLHPTQKPVALFEYLIKTYTNEGEVVLDNCLGSGTTAIAAINTNRNFIGIEKEWEYCEIANERIEKAKLDIKNEVL